MDSFNGIIGAAFLLPDKPHHAKWLTPEERTALEQELEKEKSLGGGRRHMTVFQALRHPKVLLLATAYGLVRRLTIEGLRDFKHGDAVEALSADADRFTWVAAAAQGLVRVQLGGTRQALLRDLEDRGLLDALGELRAAIPASVRSHRSSRAW